MTLTSPEFLQKLESLHLLVRKVLGGSLQADRRSIKKGSGITFADYAEYNPGDDYRAIDWRVFARFESLLIKLFELEEDATIYLLVDTSPSMQAKLQQARELAAALGYIALNTHDRLATYALADTLKPLLEPTRGKAKLFPFLRALETAPTFGSATDFTSCCRQFQARHRRRGVVIVISDFLFPGGFDDGLSFLQWHNHDVFCLQTLAPNDLKWDFVGDCDLTCVESNESRRLTITPEDARRFEAAVAEWNDDLVRSCKKRGIGLASTLNDVPSDVVVRDILRRGGLVAS